MPVNLKAQSHVPTADEIRANLLDFIAHKATEAELRALKHQVGLLYGHRLVAEVTAAGDELGYTDEDFERILNDPDQ